MCGSDLPDRGLTEVDDRALRWLDASELHQVARIVADQEEVRRTAAGFIGYGSTSPGDRVLLAVDTHYDPRVPDVLARVLRERGARVDVLVLDAEPDREVDELDEVRTLIRNEPWENNPRRWEGVPWVERLAVEQGYDLLVHGKGGGIPATPHRYEAFPWLSTEQFASTATTFPRDLHVLINRKLWAMFSEDGRGGRVTLTDPEGTELRYTLLEEYFDGTRRGYGEDPWWGHVMGHAPTPILPNEDAEGVVAGTTNHVSKAFPRIRVELRRGRVERVHGGGAYGEEWRRLLGETSGTKYPSFPGPGLFWLWEVAIGTNPKISRPANLIRLASGGFEWERRRSGVVHVGLGTRWRGAEERWAAERGITYGHLHVHQLFPTLKIRTRGGADLTVIDHGRLTVLDDPEVRSMAARYGDPDFVLAEEWVPRIPGVSASGSFEDYAKDPVPYIYS